MLCCDVVLWCCVVMLCCDNVCDGVWDVVCDGVSGGECCGKVKWMILSCLGVLVTDGRTDGRTDIGDSRVAFATENIYTCIVPCSICLNVPSTSSQIAFIFSFSWINSSSIWSILMFNLWIFISEFSACVSAAFNLGIFLQNLNHVFKWNLIWLL